MIRELLSQIWGIAVNDAIMQTFWLSAVDPTVRLYLRMAPQDAVMPYVNYNIVTSSHMLSASMFDQQIIWPMKNFYLAFSVYDYGASNSRALAIATRIEQLYAKRGYGPDPTIATAARTYEPLGPHEVDTQSKLVSRYDVEFLLRAYDAAAATVLVDGSR